MSTALVIASCSNRKRIAPTHELRARDLPPGPSDELASIWISRVARAKDVVPASELYCGRNFIEARKAARVVRAPLYIVSAGLGLVHADDVVPSYGLTVSLGSPDSILAKITRACSAEEWWDVGAARSPFCRGLSATMQAHQFSQGLLLLALPGTYLRMIQHEWLQLPERVLSRTRIFSGVGAGEVAPRLRPFLMPYDGRLDGKDSAAPGTMTDFAARALADFTHWVLPELARAEADEHRRAVSRRLSSWAFGSHPARERCSDEHLIALIRKSWNQAGSSASRMLRYFRDDMGIACEQARFVHLFAQVQTEMETAT